jgi:type IV pilus assembly protein PilQ
MKTFLRFLLLVLFAAIGGGLAIYVGLSADPAAGQPQSQENRLAVCVRTPDDPPPEKPAAEAPPLSRDGADRPTEVRGSRGKMSGPPEETFPHPLRRQTGPALSAAWRDQGSADGEFVPGETAPRWGQQVPPAVSKADIEKAVEYLQQRLAPPPGAPGAAAPAAPVLAAPPLPSAVPAPGPALAPASPGAVPAPPIPAFKSARPVVKADAEGDGKLTIHIQNSDIREVLDLLSEQGGLNILAGPSVQGKVSATLTGVDIQSALDAILKSTGYVARRQGRFIFVGKPDDFTNLEQAMDKVGTRVYRPNYISSSELKALIQPMLTEKVGAMSVSTPSEAGIGTDDTKAGGNNYAGGDVVLVRDFEAVLAQIDQLVAEVDIRPLQVHIDAMILSVKLSDENQFGVDFQLLRAEPHVRFGWGSPPGAVSDVKFDNGGLKFGYLDGNLGAFIQAVEKVGDTNVIARPRLMVLNKHRAEILIGEKKGYVSTTVTETASSQSVEFLEVGAQLRLRPFISRDGLIRMEVHPELSDGNVETVNNFTLPNKEVTEVTTNIMVRDGCTVIIGGLIKEQLANTTTGIPYLGSMPWVGPLFRTTKQTTERHEVIVLITPRIVYEPGTCREGEKSACEFERRQATVAEKMCFLGKRHVARRYVRLAQNAWAAGDRNTAMRFAELAVHFDPLSREAIELRSEIWQGKPAAGSATAASAPGAGPLDGRSIDDWVLEDLARPSPQPAAVPLHPFDPGQPGLHKDIVRPRNLQ